MRLILGAGKVDERATRVLRKTRLRAKNDGDLNSAVVSAGFYAKKWNRTMHVYLGNTYGHLVWRVSYKPSEYLSPVNNGGTAAFSVTPDLTVTEHPIDPSARAPSPSPRPNHRSAGYNEDGYQIPGWTSGWNAELSAHAAVRSFRNDLLVMTSLEHDSAPRSEADAVAVGLYRWSDDEGWRQLGQEDFGSVTEVLALDDAALRRLLTQGA